MARLSFTYTLAAVVDLAERMQAGTLRSDFAGRERVRREFGISG